MKAIQTKYLPATDYKGSRIKATAEGVPSLTIDYPHERNHGEDAHRIAAEALAARQGWKAPLVAGCLPSGDWVFCFIPREFAALLEVAKELHARVTYLAPESFDDDHHEGEFNAMLTEAREAIDYAAQILTPSKP